MNREVDLSIVIPAFQEAKRIETTLEELGAYLKDHDYGRVEVLVIVADSPDGTAELARAKAGLFELFRVVDAGPKVGKGRDVRVGMLEASGQYRIFMDADLATPLHHLAEVKEFMERGGKVGIAVRKLDTIHTGFRQFVSETGNILVRVLLLPGIPDSQCGFKVFAAEAAEETFRRQTITGWGFDMEILAIARKLGYPIEQFPVLDWEDKPHGTIHESIKSAAFETLGDLLLIVWHRATGKYRKRTFTYEPHQTS